MEKDLDPYDMSMKKELHPLADEKNFIDTRMDTLVLRCGARKKKTEGFCKSIAGAGTDHPGYGRCKYCGGASTGPKTEEGRSAVGRKNARKHGLYAQYLTDEEQERFGEIRSKNDLTVAEELALLRTKLESYYKYVYLLRKGAGRKGLQRMHLKRGDKVEYEMGSIEDPNVQKTLEQIRRLIATSNAIGVYDEEDVVTKMNAELKAAAHMDVAISWGDGSSLATRITDQRTIQELKEKGLVKSSIKNDYERDD